MSDIDNPMTGSHSCPSPTSKRSDIISMPGSASQDSNACTTVIVTVNSGVLRAGSRKPGDYATVCAGRNEDSGWVPGGKKHT